MPEIKSARLFDFICVALLLAFALAIAYPRWRAGIDWRDEGLLAYGSERVMLGEVPHRDFVSLQPPLSFYAVAALFKIGGTSLFTLRLLGLSIFLLLPLLIYGVARSLGSTPVLSFAAAAPACVLGLPYTLFVPLAVWQGIAASFAAVFFFTRATLSARRWLALVAGLFTACALFLRHDQAAYTMVAILALVLALSFASDPVRKGKLRRALLFLLAGIAIIAIPALIIWCQIGALPEMFQQLVVFPLATYRKTSALPFPKITAGKTAVETAVVLLFYLPVFVQIVTALYLAQSIVRRRFGRREAILAFLLVWSALFFLQVMVRSDQTHLLITLPPLFLLAAFAWSIVQETIVKHRKTRIALSAVLAIAVASYLWVLHSVMLPDVTRAQDQLSLERGGVRVAGASVITNFVHKLQNDVPPTRSILALPYQPMFYFLCERRNPTRWNYLWPGDQTAQDHARFIEESERDPPARILLSEQRELAESAPAILEYVRIHYLLTDQFGNLSIYERLDSR
jgi:hypothetical protein